jgi:hypothetical protein
MTMKARLLIATLALILSGAALADAPTWGELTDKQRVVLSQFEQNWNDLPAERRMRLSRGAERWAQMSPRQRQHAKARFKDWRGLPVERRARVRERAELFNSLAPEEQARIRKNYKRFHEMKRERREMLRERYEQLTPEQRRELHERLDRRRGGPHGR